MNTEEEKLSIESLGGGAALERFNDALVEVLANILDPNTGKGAREINLKVKVKPNDERTMAEVRVECKAKLQGASDITTHAYLGIDSKGSPEAHEIRPMAQQQMPFASNVVKMEGVNKR